MYKSRKIMICTCIVISMVLMGNGVKCVDAKENINLTQVTNSSVTIENEVSQSDSKSILSNIVEILKNIGIVLTAIMTAINIYKWYVERKYEIEYIILDLISNDNKENECCTRFVCESVKYKDEKVDLFERNNPYYFRCTIKMQIPSTRRKINNLVLKNISIYMEDYKLMYKGLDKEFFGRRKCIVDRQNDVCEILLKVPNIKNVEERKFNPVVFFANPQRVHMQMKWSTMNIVIFSIISFWFPQITKFEFEKIEYQNNVPKIAIKSKKIY